MKSRVVEAVNEQIREEFESAYVYLALSARLEALDFPGSAHWMRQQAQEEVAHAMKFFDFLVRRGEEPVLEALARPEVTVSRPIDAFKSGLEHERHITGCIHKLYDLAVDERDYPLRTLLHWFIDEQVEEEETAEAIIKDLERVGESGEGLFMIDRELGQRVADGADEKE